MSRAGGPVTLRITAISVNSPDAGAKIVASAEHEANANSAATTFEVAHSGTAGPSGNRSVDVTVPTLAGNAYDLTIESVQGPTSPGGPPLLSRG